MTSRTSASGATAATARSRGIAVAGGVVAAVVVWVVAGPVAGAALDVETSGSDTQHVGVGAVILASAVTGLLGWALLALLERFTAGAARTVWTVVASLFLLVSLLGPASATTTGSTVALVCMHLAVAAVVVPLMARTARRS